MSSPPQDTLSTPGRGRRTPEKSARQTQPPGTQQHTAASSLDVSMMESQHVCLSVVSDGRSEVWLEGLVSSASGELGLLGWDGQLGDMGCDPGPSPAGREVGAGQWNRAVAWRSCRSTGAPGTLGTLLDLRAAKEPVHSTPCLLKCCAKAGGYPQEEGADVPLPPPCPPRALPWV